MSDGRDSGGNKPGQAKQGVNGDQDGEHQEVQVVTFSFLGGGNTGPEWGEIGLTACQRSLEIELFVYSVTKSLASFRLTG